MAVATAAAARGLRHHPRYIFFGLSYFYNITNNEYTLLIFTQDGRRFIATATDHNDNEQHYTPLPTPGHLNMSNDHPKRQ